MQRLTRGRGYIRDAGQHYVSLGLAARHGTVSLAAAPLKVSGEKDLLQWAPPVLDQNGTRSCTGHGTATALFAAYGAKAAPLAWVPSPSGIYNVARCVDRVENLDGSYPKLSDEGAQPSSIFRGLMTFGIRPMGARASDGRLSDCDPATINDEEKLFALEGEVVHPIVGPYDLEGDRVTQVRQCIDSAIPVGVGGFIDTGFENWTPSSPAYGAPNAADPKGGGHWMALMGYRTRADGSSEFLLRNSWGDGWGDAGNVWVNEGFLAALWQLIAITVTP